MPEQATTLDMADPHDGSAYGFLRVGSVELALPLSCLREVVRRPARLVDVPAASPVLRGAIEVRTQLIPVVDVRADLGIETGDPLDEVIVIVSNGSSMVGLLVDDVAGVSWVERDALQPLHSASDSIFVSHVLRRGGETTAFVLDVEKIFARSDVPTVVTSTRNEDSAGHTTETRRMTMLECGGVVLGIDVADVYTTLPGSSPSDSVLARETCLGVAAFRGRTVPVVDPVALLELGRLPAGRSGADIVIEIADGFVILAVSKLLEIVDVAVDNVLPVAAMSVGRPEFIDGVIETAHDGLCFVLDVDALRNDADMAALAELNVVDSTEEIGAGERTRVATGEAQLTYAAGVDVATPLAQVDEIIPYPKDATTANASSGLLGLIAHRGEVIPLICLSTSIGTARDTEPGCVLLVSGTKGRVGFAIDRLHRVDHLAWTDPDHTGDDRSSVPGVGPMIQVGTSKQLLPALDLRALVDRTLG